MKNKSEHEDYSDHQALEILKAVAQAWHSHSGTSSTASEYDAHRRNFQANPSRFKLEALKNKSLPVAKRVDSSNWDFRQSLMDSYEIVSVAKKLERGLVLLDEPFSGLDTSSRRVYKRQRESKNSPRNLFKILSSRRFNEAAIAIPRQDN